MNRKRRQSNLSERPARQRRRPAAATGTRPASPFSNLNWFDANVAAFLMERGGELPVASRLVYRKSGFENDAKRHLKAV